MKNIFLLLLLFIGSFYSYSQDTIMPLWDVKIPNQLSVIKEKEQHNTDNGFLWVTNVQQPTLEVYLPSKANANGQGVLIFPGGGYAGLAYDWEGVDIAKALNAKGIAAIVVKYRLPISTSLRENKWVPLQDAQRAIRKAKYFAKNWNIADGKLGIMGFSAGGHLASSLGVHYLEKTYTKEDEIDQITAQPDFMVLVYPVITFKDTKTHMGSRNALIGEQAKSDDILYFSNELHVNEHTAPTILIHASDDEGVPVENSLWFYQALKDKKVPVSMHIYPHGGHGFSLATRDHYLKNWMQDVFLWLQSLE